MVAVCGLTVPLDGFCEWMKKLPQETPKNTGPKSSLAESKAGKPGSASIVSNDTDLRSYRAPVLKSSTKSSPLAGLAPETPENPVRFRYSILLALSFWLTILHFTQVSLGSKSILRLIPPSSYTGCAWHQDGGGPASPWLAFSAHYHSKTANATKFPNRRIC